MSTRPITIPTRNGRPTYPTYTGTTIMVHRAKAEAAFGKPLPPGAIVHHADGTMSVDSPLVICQDQAYHKLLHVRMRVRDAGGDPNTERICVGCKTMKNLAAFPPCAMRLRHWYCTPCIVAANKRRRLAKRAAA